MNTTNKIYDLIIIGTGPAGLTAGIYAIRHNLDFIMIGKDLGMITESNLVENYPGFISITGNELIGKFKQHAEHFGVKIINDEVLGVKKEENIFITATKSNEYKSKTLIIAAGTEKRKLNLPNEDKFIGKGISYCTTCDAPFFKDKIVAVVGGSDSAVVSALHLKEFAKKVYIIYRKNKLRAEPIRVKIIEENPKIEVIYNANIKEIIGENKVEGVKLDNGSEIKLDGIFIEIGAVPTIAFAKELGIKTDDKGYIIIKQDQSTNIPGVFAAGDITTGSNMLMQVITASAEGAIAAVSVYNYLTKE